MHAKQESVKSLIFHNETVFLTHVYLSVLQPNKSFEAAPYSTPYCLPSLLATSNQISLTGEAPHGGRVYGRKNMYIVYPARASNGKHGTCLAVL